MRVAASVAMAAAVATGMAGCMLITPQQTSRSYTPSDGINAHVGDVAIRNAMLIVNGEGDAGTLVAAFVNSADSARTVRVEYATADGGSEEQRISVPADGRVSLGAPEAADADGDSVVLEDIDAPLGALFQVVVTSGSADDTLQLPILTGSLSEYATLVPTPTPTPTRTKRSTPTPTDGLSTEEPTGSPTPSATPSE